MYIHSSVESDNLHALSGDWLKPSVTLEISLTVQNNEM